MALNDFKYVEKILSQHKTGIGLCNVVHFLSCSFIRTCSDIQAIDILMKLNVWFWCPVY